MFTGIITDIGTVEQVTGTSGRSLRIATSYDAASIDIGASIACNGVCLTVTERGTSEKGSWFDVDCGPETLAVTTVQSWSEGTRLNLERALKVGDELGGHIVSGHVDGIAEVLSVEQSGDATIIRFAAPPELARFIAPKGSVALNGTSLTVNGVNGTEFDVCLIPHTLTVTNWGKTHQGDRINIEIDTMARYAARLAEMPA